LQHISNNFPVYSLSKDVPVTIHPSCFHPSRKQNNMHAQLSYTRKTVIIVQLSDITMLRSMVKVRGSIGGSCSPLCSGFRWAPSCYAACGQPCIALPFCQLRTTVTTVVKSVAIEATSGVASLAGHVLWTYCNSRTTEAIISRHVIPLLKFNKLTEFQTLQTAHSEV